MFFQRELVMEKDGLSMSWFGEGWWHGFPRIALGAGNGEEQAPPTNLDPLQLYTHVHAGEHFF